MLYIALNVFFNAILLGMIFVVGADFLHISNWVAITAGYVVSALLTIIGYTRLGTLIVGVFMPGRTMIGRERQKLEPLLSDVINQTNSKYGTYYKLDDFKIRVTDDKVVNAFALGYNVITVNRGAFEAFTDEQLRAILAHEMGHLYYRDSVKRIALIFSSIATRVLMWAYAIYAAIVTALGVGASKDRSGVFALMALCGFVLMMLFIPVVILNWLGSKLFNLLNLAMSRRSEYRADAFASSLGYKTDLVAALEVLDGLSISDNSFMGKITATHPSAMERIGALEDGEIARRNIGGLFIASAAVGVQPSFRGLDSLRMAFLLLIVGGAWCGINMYNAYQRNVRHELTFYNEFKGNDAKIQHRSADNLKKSAKHSVKKRKTRTKKVASSIDK
jgi:Zn-dependent protease with chaperone function